MNQTAQNKNKRVPIPQNMMNQRLQEPSREQYKQHPLYAEKMREALQSLSPEFPAELIPDGFKDWVLAALMQRSYPACGTKKIVNGIPVDVAMPLQVYADLINEPATEWGFGEIKAAAEMVWESKPIIGDKYCIENDAVQHLYKLESIGKIKIWFDEFMQPIENKALDESIAELKEKQSKEQAKKSIIR